MKQNIILIGMRGSGKTTVGKKFAKKQGMSFIDTDAEIEKYEGRKISEIVKQGGWEAFRKSESHICSQAGRMTNTVISTGGGVILNPKNIISLKKNGTCVFLNIPLGMILSRLGKNRGTHRPSLTEEKSFKKELRQIHAERYHLYCQSADYICRETSLRRIIERIIQRMNRDEYDKQERE